jgi:hypothetical protein
MIGGKSLYICLFIHETHEYFLYSQWGRMGLFPRKGEPIILLRKECLSRLRLFLLTAPE